MLSIDSSDLRIFLLIHERGSFRRAAATLGVQQSSISRRMRDLEDQLGASLFQRHSGGVDLTFAGQRFLIHARVILSDMSESVREIAEIGRSKEGYLRIWLASSIVSGTLLGLLGRYRRTHPRVFLDLVEASSEDYGAALEDLRLDLAFACQPDRLRGVEVLELWSEDLFLAVPEEHRLAGDTVVSWKDLSDEVIILADRGVGRYLHDHLVLRVESSKEPRVQWSRVGQSGVLALVAMGWGLSLVTESVTILRIPGIYYRRMSTEALRFGAVWSPRNDNPALRQLLSLARKIDR